MGSGASRQAEGTPDEIKPLDPQLSTRLGAALLKLDKADPAFKGNRDEERFAQIVKRWNRITKTMDEYLRAVGLTLHATHQLNLDIGVEGSGQNTRPWMEEVSKRFPKLSFRLEESNIHAVAGERSIARLKIEDLSYEWVMRVVVEWLVSTVELKK